MERDGFEISARGKPAPADYLNNFEDDDLSEEEKLELVSVLFEIMKSFVQLGYGLEPVNRLIAEFQKSVDADVDLLECKDDEIESCNE